MDASNDKVPLLNRPDATVNSQSHAMLEEVKIQGGVKCDLNKVSETENGKISVGF